MIDHGARSPLEILLKAVDHINLLASQPLDEL
jgi:hypothetical protein